VPVAVIAGVALLGAIAYLIVRPSSTGSRATPVQQAASVSTSTTTSTTSTVPDGVPSTDRLQCPGRRRFGAIAGQSGPGELSADAAAQSEATRFLPGSTVRIVGDDQHGQRYVLLDSEGTVRAEIVVTQTSGGWHFYSRETCA